MSHNGRAAVPPAVQTQYKLQVKIQFVVKGADESHMVSRYRLANS